MEYGQRVSRFAAVARRNAFDVLVVLLTLVAMLETARVQGSEDGPDTTLWLLLPAIALLTLPLLARRRYPFAGPAAYWLLAAALAFVDGRLVPSVASLYLIGMAAAFLLGNLRNSLEARVGLAIVLGSAATIVYNIPDHSSGELLFVPLVFGICWLAGFALRGQAVQAEAAEARAAQAERDREAAARIAVAEERVRIARELHDIVAHAVSVMVLQVGAVRHNLPDQLAGDAEALKGVEKTGRTALTEMRRLLGAMRRDGDDLELAPQPGLDAIESLLAEVGRAGLPVQLHVDGERIPVPRALDLSAYRIVQEGLTNALKHAGAEHADVTLRYEPDLLRIEVRDDGTGGASGGSPGYGLVGIRERVKIYGGEMSSGPAPGGGFALEARLPLGGDAA